MHDHHHHDHEVPADVLLAHMVEHNENHLHELEHLAEHLTGAAAEQVSAAVATIREGNRQLAKALETLKEN